MELKSYQEEVIKDLSRYLDILRQNKGNYAQSFRDFWEKHPLYPKTAHYQDNIKNCPHVCFKVPTAGGKTFLACNTLPLLFQKLGIESDRMVLWLVPSQAILEQTYKNLSNPQHYYRQKLQQHFGSRVEVYNIEQLLQASNGFNCVGVQENVSILVLSYQSIRADKQTKEGRRMYRENSALSPFFEHLESKDFLLNQNEIDEKSLINVIRKYNPLCIIDEAHNATSDLSVEMLHNINPCFVLELTATPRKLKKGKHETEISNIISYVDSFALKAENMIKLPILVQNLHSKQDVLTRAIALQKELENYAKKNPDYVRPMVLCQAEPNRKEDNETFLKIKESLIQKGIPESHIAIKTADKDELKKVDLLAKNCPIRYIITVDALKEGWDCPFAYILATVANKNSEISVEQIVGRVLRRPYTKNLGNHFLNMSYILTSSNKFQEVLDKIVLALNSQGLSEKDLKASKDNKNPLVLEIQKVEVFGKNSENMPEKAILESELSPEEAQTDTEKFLEEAQSYYQQDQKQHQQIVENGIKPIPHDLKNKVHTNTMKEIFKAHAQSIRLPQFFIEIPRLSIFENQSEAKLSVESLLKDFDLSKKSTDIPFDKIEIDLHEIDLEFNGQESHFGRAKATQARQSDFLKLFQEASTDTQIKALADRFIHFLGSLPPFEEKDLRKYIKRVVEDFDLERLNHAAARPHEYSAKIKKHIQNLSSEYTEKQFYSLVDREKIYTKASFALPTQNVAQHTSSIKKSLFEKTELLNDFEKKIIGEIAGYENLVFWHKFANRGQYGFPINGCFMNHYPDFLILTQSNRKILLETKGGHLVDNEDSIRKAKLGKKWAELSGREYRYFMVSDKNLENCHSLDQFKETLQDL